MCKNMCSKCSLCCTMLEVPELNKPIGQKCIYNIDLCVIYDNRPDSCKKFECGWLKHNLNFKLRPDKCHVIFEKIFINPIYIALVDPEYPDSWKDDMVFTLINEMIRTNYAVVIKINNKLEKFFVPKKQTKDNVLASIKLFSEIVRGQENGCTIIHNGSNTHT
jgi:hypothetical protein